MKMDVEQLTLANLIKKTKDELVKTDFSKLSLEKIELVWKNLEQYLRNKDVNYFSMDHAMAFLRERYRFTETGRPASINQRQLRAIQLLADFQAHQRIFIRRKKKGINSRNLLKTYSLNLWILERAREFQAERLNRMPSIWKGFPDIYPTTK
jgi:hypothetical protein